MSDKKVNEKDKKKHEEKKRGKKEKHSKKADKKAKKAAKKAKEKATEPFEADMKAMLKGKHCDGCHNHCKLSKPKCAKGRKARDKILASL
ncbi:MAG: hypothetical protein LIV22_00010 [Olegusella sp.]|jgi:hypothetical protein|nr:hypothetical protein [Olegusella sp.]